MATADWRASHGKPLLKAAGITPDTKGHEAERALFSAAWECVKAARAAPCRHAYRQAECNTCAALAAFDEAAKFFQEDV